MQSFSKGNQTLFVYSFRMVAGLTLYIALSTTCFQGDLFDEDRTISSVEYGNADVHKVLRALLREINGDYVIESGINGPINLRLKHTPFSVVLKKVVSQVHASVSFQNGVFFVEDAPNLADYEGLMSRKLPRYNFTKTKVGDALKTIFIDAHVKVRLPLLPDVAVDNQFREQTLRQAIDWILPLTKCRLAYRRGRFDFIPKSEELLPGGLLDKRVAAADFLDTSAKDAFSTLFSQTGVQFVLGPDIDSRVTMRLQSRKLEQALDILCQATDTNYRWHGDVVQIERVRFDSYL
jgi:hypothetical protein